jgi:hypothetical protein
MAHGVSFVPQIMKKYGTHGFFQFRQQHNQPFELNNAGFLNADGFKERRQVPAGRKEQARKQYVTFANVNWKNKNPGDIHSRQN